MSNKSPMSETHSRNMIHYWMRQETSRLRAGITVFASTILIYSIPFFSIYNKRVVIDLILRSATLIVIIIILRFLCCTKFAIRHSAIGKQFSRFGEFQTVYTEICAAAKTPIYTNDTEVISEKYIFLMPEPANASSSPTPFSAPAKLLILSVYELERVSVKPNAPYPDEMNTLLFRTAKLKEASLDNRLYMMTVHMDKEAAQVLADLITQKIPREIYQEDTKTSGIPPFSHPARAHSYPFKTSRTPASRSFARFGANPLKELRAGKMRVFYLTVFLIIFVNIGTLMLVYLLTDGHTLSTIPHDLSSFIHHELISNPEQIFFLLGLLAFYLIPTLLIYLGIQCWYRRFLAEYEKLPSTEQKELLKKLCDNFETGQPVVIYTEHCFCFRNLRALSFQTLLSYTSVLWIYRTHTAFALPTKTPGTEYPVEFYHLIIRTENCRKYRIASSNEPELARHAPEAVVGYGDIQRETYLDLRRKRKER